MNRAALCLLICSFSWGYSARATLGIETANSDARVEALIDKLDADLFAKREEAQQELISHGARAIPALHQAIKLGSREQATRSRNIIRAIRHDFLVKRFSRLARQPDEKIDVEEGMWLIAFMVDPEVSQLEIKRQLDEWSGKVRRHFGAIDPKQAEPRVAVEKMMQVLCDPNTGFGHANHDYDNPRNSSIDHVLKSRRGLQIMVSHVFISVAKRLELPVVGIGVPGHYMVKYEVRKAPVKEAQKDILIDVYYGRITSANEIAQRFRGFNPKVHLQPMPNRYVLLRMLNNISQHYDGKDEGWDARRAEEYGRILARPAPRNNGKPAPEDH